MNAHVDRKVARPHEARADVLLGLAPKPLTLESGLSIVAPPARQARA